MLGDSYDGSGNASHESQSSQIIAFALGNAGDWAGGDGSEVLGGGDDNRGDANASVDQSFAPAPPDASASGSSLGSVPRYHFHGLAATQTQSQYGDDAPREGSQKENTPTSSSDRLPPVGASSSSSSSLFASSEQLNHANPARASLTSLNIVKGVAQGFPLSPRLPLHTATPHKGHKVVSLLSPAPPNHKNQPDMGRYLRRRSPSPTSQDSFAGPSVLQDPDLFLASSRLFEKPLEELGLSNTPDAVPAGSSEQQLPGRRQAVSMSEAGRSPSRATPYSLSSTSAHLGNVLVANSDDSQPSGSLGGSQFSVGVRQTEGFYDPVLLSQQSTQMLDSSEHSVVLDDVLRDEPTQIIQESSQPDIEERETKASHAYSIPTASVATSVSEPRSILNLVAPEKRDRYRRHGVDLTPRVAPPGPSLHTKPVPNLPPPSAPRPDNVGPEESYVASSSPIKLPQQLVQSETQIVPDSEQYSTPAKAPPPAPHPYPMRHIPDEVIPASESENVAPTSDAASMKREVNEEEEEEEEVEEDVPLAKVVSKPPSMSSTHKGKQRAIEKPVLPSPLKSKPPRTRPIRQVAAQESAEVVPSSVPMENNTKPRSITPRAVKNESKPKKVISARSKAASRRWRRVRSTSHDTRSSKPPTEHTDDGGSTSDEPLAQRCNEEEDTEGADDDSMDLDEAPVPGPSRKRKRVTPLASKKSAPRVPKPGKGSIVTPSVPPAKRAKTAVPFGSSDAARVIALWKSDGHYYSGTVHSADKVHSMRFLIKFDDGSEDTVDISKMRASVLNPGDDILLLDQKCHARVLNAEKWDDDHAVLVEIDDGDDTKEVEIGSTDFRVASRTITGRWKDRVLTVADIIPVVGRKPLKDTPSPSKLSIASGPNAKAVRRILGKTGFVITLGPGNTHWEKEKDKLVRTINDTGGTVISDWSDIFPMNGKHQNGNKRWVICKEDVSFAKRDHVERVFLLADGFNQKPKFLIALALGIPCVSIDWLEECIAGQDQVPWQSFLLPAGFSEPLHARVSQMVDLDWGNSIDHLREIMSNPVPHKLLSEKSILCLGADLLPMAPRKNGSDAERVVGASRTVPRIILAMGAARVEAVADVRYASDKDLTNFDYVVVKDIPPKLVQSGVNCVDVSWIKECLIAGRLLELPDWAR